MKQDLNILAARIHKQNHQWWHSLEDGKPIERNKGELLMLVITELSEAVEGIRKNLMDNHCPEWTMESMEMADTKIRILDFAAGFGIVFTADPTEIATMLPPNKAEAILWICKRVMAIYDASPGEGVHDQIVMALAYIESYCRHHLIELDAAVDTKLIYNRDRADHKREARLLADGKKF